MRLHGNLKSKLWRFSITFGLARQIALIPNFEINISFKYLFVCQQVWHLSLHLTPLDEVSLESKKFFILSHTKKTLIYHFASSALTLTTLEAFFYSRTFFTLNSLSSSSVGVVKSTVLGWLGLAQPSFPCRVARRKFFSPHQHLPNINRPRVFDKKKASIML